MGRTTQKRQKQTTWQVLGWARIKPPDTNGDDTTNTHEVRVGVLVRWANTGTGKGRRATTGDKVSSAGILQTWQTTKYRTRKQFQFPVLKLFGKRRYPAL